MVKMNHASRLTSFFSTFSTFFFCLCLFLLDLGFFPLFGPKLPRLSLKGRCFELLQWYSALILITIVAFFVLIVILEFFQPLGFSL